MYVMSPNLVMYSYVVLVLYVDTNTFTNTNTDTKSLWWRWCTVYWTEL